MFQNWAGGCGTDQTNPSLQFSILYTCYGSFWRLKGCLPSLLSFLKAVLNVTILLLFYVFDIFGRMACGIWCWSWNSNTLATWGKELTHWKRPWCWERLKVGGEADDRGWDGWMASPTQWTWVWVNSGSWWWTGRPGVLQSMGSQRVGHDWATELNWTWDLICPALEGSLSPWSPSFVSFWCPDGCNKWRYKPGARGGLLRQHSAFWPDVI